MEFWRFFYKHWNYDLIQTLELLSCRSTANIEIVALSFQALEFWAYFYKHWNSHLIVPDTGILPYFYTHWHSYLIHLNVGILAVRIYADFFYRILQNLGFSPYFCKHWDSYIILQTCNSDPISISIGVMILFNQTLQFWPLFCTPWNFALIFRNIGVLALLLETLEFLSCPSTANIEIFIHAGFLILSFKTLAF